MQLTVTRQALLHSVQRCQSIVERRHTVPILSNLLLEAQDSRLRISATDLEVGLRTSAIARIGKSGTTTVSARKLFEVLRELAEDADVQLHTEGAFLHVNSGRSKFRLAILQSDDFPAVQEEEEATTLNIDGRDLARMIANTSFAMSHDETRKYLTGTLFDLNDTGRLRLVATDGHRLAMTEAILQQHPQARSCIVPRKAVAEMRKLAEEVEGQVTLYLGERQIRLVADAHSLSSKLVDARFPSYEDVIPSDNPSHATLEAGGFDQVLRRIMIVANEFTHDVRLQFKADALLVSAHNTEQEEAEESIEADYDGPEILIGFNARYLRDVLSVVQGPKVTVQLKDGLSPVLVLDEGDASSRYVIMPMRI